MSSKAYCSEVLFTKMKSAGAVIGIKHHTKFENDIEN